MCEKKQIQLVENGLLVRAPAKINLSLLITGKRPDGFHGIETIMAKIDWFDEILIQHSSKTGIDVTSKGPYWAPQGKENLIYTACELLLAHCGIESNLRLTLTKNIPAGSGLGSASSDAAACLLGVNHLLNFGVSKSTLKQLAAKLGSDVAFFLDGPLSLCTGKGEKIEKIEKKFDFLTILITPNVSVSTKTVYINYKHDDDKYRNWKRKINSLLEKNKIDLIPKICANMLQTSCFELHQDLAELKNKVESLGIRPLCLSGSGSAMYSIVEYNDRKNAEKYQCELMEKFGFKSVIVRNNRW